MNERIKELAQQAEMASNMGDHVDVEVMMEKFAELIIKECTEQCDRVASFTKNKNIMAYEAATSIKHNIEEQFGVE